MTLKRQAIPEPVRQWAGEVIQAFNARVIRDPNRYFTPRYRGSYLYLDRLAYGGAHHVCRLTYAGGKDTWEFAIFKYSNERYDPNEWFFPGSEHVDGTIDGAMQAGLAAYP